MISLCTWNVNSIRKRIPLLRLLVDSHDPDILCLQETRGPLSKDFLEAFADTYKVYESPSIKGRSGVTTLIKHHLESRLLVSKGFLSEMNMNGRLVINDFLIGDDKRGQIINVYVHQGSSYANGRTYSNVKSPAFDDTAYKNKKKFLESIDTYVSGLNCPFIIAGDFNVVMRTNDS